MAKIYRYPEGVSAPPSWQQFKVDGKYNHEKHREAENVWIEELRSWCKKNNHKCEEAGKIIEEGVADGAAIYMVFSIKPVKLIHIPIGDAWEFQWAHRWTSSDIKQMIKRKESLEAFIKERQQEVEKTRQLNGQDKKCT